MGRDARSDPGGQGRDPHRRSRRSQPDRIALVLEQDADVLIRAGWRNARWLDAEGAPVDLLAEFRKASDCGRIDRSIFIGRKERQAARFAARRRQEVRASPRRAAGGASTGARAGPSDFQVTLAAAEWVILVTSLPPQSFMAADVLALDRLRRRIELGFKRLKSLIGLKDRPELTNVPPDLTSWPIP